MFRKSRRAQSDFQEEVQAHLASEAESLESEGMSPDEARAAARRQFGNVLQAEERFYERGRTLWLDNVARDVRLALRTLVKSRGLTVAAVLILTLGIGATTAIFTILYALMLRTLPVRDAHELVLVDTRFNNVHVDALSYQTYRELRDGDTGLSHLAGSAQRQVAFGSAGDAQTIPAELVSGNYFEMLGVAPAAGRLFGSGDDLRGNSPVCVISHRLWVQRFGGDPAMAGRMIRLNSGQVTVAGVAPAGFDGIWPGEPAMVWLPLSAAQSVVPQSASGGEFAASLLLLGRRKPGVPVEQVRVALQSLYAQMPPPGRPSGAKVELSVESGARGPGFLRERLAGPVAILMATTVLVLLLGCANLATLLLARGAARRREVAIRLMLGAGRRRLIASLMVESLLMAGAGAAVGLVFSRLLVRGFVLLAPMAGGLPAQLDLAADWRVVLFCAVSALITAVLFGMAPAAAITRLDPLTAFRTDSDRGHSQLILRKSLVTAQVALSVVLLSSAGLFAGTLRSALRLQLGFQAENLILIRLDPVANGYSPAAARSVFDQALERVRALPITRSAALATDVPGSGSVTVAGVQAEGQPLDRSKMPIATVNLVSPGYFSTMRIPLLAGRDFNEGDRAGGTHVAIVNRTLAERFWPGENAVGKRLAGRRAATEIIGVAGDQQDPAAVWNAPLQMFCPEGQFPFPSLVLHVRANAAPGPAIEMLRAELGKLAPDLPITDVKTMEGQLREAVSIERLLAVFTAAFAFVALLLAGTGIYGVVAYEVVRRTREVGIRMALGARRVHVLRLVATQAGLLTGLGLAIGLLAALAAARVAATLVHGLRPYAATTYLVVLGVLLATGVASALAPAWRALSVDPSAALRHE